VEYLNVENLGNAHLARKSPNRGISVLGLSSAAVKALNFSFRVFFLRAYGLISVLIGENVFSFYEAANESQSRYFANRSAFLHESSPQVKLPAQC